MRIANILLTATLSLTQAVRAEETAVPPCQVQSVALDGVELHATLGTHDSNAMRHWVTTDKTTVTTKNKIPKLVIHGSKRAKYYLTKLREEDVYNFFFVTIGNGVGCPTYPAEVQINTKPLPDGNEEVIPVEPLTIGVYAIWAAFSGENIERTSFKTKEAFQDAVEKNISGRFWSFRVETSARPLECGIKSVQREGIELKATAGSYEANKSNQWTSLDKPKAASRTTNRKPTLTLTTTPSARYNLVKLTEEDSYRYLYLVNAKKGCAKPSGSGSDLEFTSRPGAAGVLELVPDLPLKPGEYAIWTALGPGSVKRSDYESEEEYKLALDQAASGVFWDFGID